MIRACLDEKMDFDLKISVTGASTDRSTVRFTIDDGEKMISFPVTESNGAHKASIPPLEGIVKPGVHTAIVEVFLEGKYFRARTEEIWLEAPTKAIVTEIKDAERPISVSVQMRDSAAPQPSVAPRASKKHTAKFIKWVES